MYDICLILRGTPTERLTAQAERLRAAGWHVCIQHDTPAPNGFYRLLDAGRAGMGWHRAYWALRQRYRAGQAPTLPAAHVYQAHDVAGLDMILWGGQKGASIVFDMADHPAETLGPAWQRAQQQYDAGRLPRLLAYTAALLTTTEAHAHYLETRYGVPRPLVVPQIPHPRYEFLYQRLLAHHRA